MKPVFVSPLVGLLVLGLSHALSQESTSPSRTNVTDLATSPADTNSPPPAALSPGAAPAEAAAAGGATHAPPSATPPAEPAPPPKPAPVLLPNGEPGLQLNFRGAPLDVVLSYFSEAAGFVVLLETEIRGRVDVWSQQPVSRDEAVNLLNTILNKNGYAAIRNERTLTIVSREEAKKRDIPVKTGNKPEEIPKNDEMVTQIVPVRYANAVQMVKDLQPLLPTYAQLTANESGNALVLTDTQADIRRMVEIVRALDTSISGIATIRVFPLRYADAKDLAAEIKELFPAPTSTGGRGGDPRAMFMARFVGGPGGAGGGAQSDGSQSEAKRAASRVTAVADERTNALVVSAPEEVMPTIEQLVKEIDTNAENITEVRVFPLAYSDPTEMADLLTSLFPDDTRSDSNRSAVQFGRGGFGRGGFGPMGMTGGGNSQTSSSTRARQKGRVLAVADERTASVVVSAASDLMPQIAEMIKQLDANPARKQKVFVYSLDHADVDNVGQVLQDMFQSQNLRNTSRQNNNNPLTRRQQNQNYGNLGSGSSISSGFGSGGGTTSRRIGQ